MISVWPQRTLGALALRDLLQQLAVGLLERRGAILDPALQHLGQGLQVALRLPALAHLGFEAAVDLLELRLARHAQRSGQHAH